MDDNSFIEIRSQEEYRYKVEVSVLLMLSPTSLYLTRVMAPCYFYYWKLGDLRSSSVPATNSQGKSGGYITFLGLISSYILEELDNC